MDGIIKRLMRWLRRPAPQTGDGIGRVVIPDWQPGTINDGVDYSQPVILTEEMEADLNRQGKLQEYLEAFSTRDSLRFQFDSPQRSGYDMPVLPVTEDPLKEWNWATRKQVLSTCHAVYERNPLANTGVQYTADFVIGEGFNLTCKNHEVSEILEAFIASPDNALREYERQAIIGLQVDGEIFLRFFEERGETVAVPIRPWEVQWIETEAGFFRRPLTYKMMLSQLVGDTGRQEYQTIDIAANEILHVAINRQAYDLRGRPELYRILPWLRADKEFVENRARQNHWRNALLWFVQVKNATPAVIASVVSRWSRPPTPGTVAVETDNVNVNPLSNSTGAADASEDGRRIKLQNIMGLRLPEYFFGDGYNANKATASAQQLPALTKFGDFQRVMVEQLWYPLFKRVLQNAIDAGVLEAEVTEEYSDGEPRMDDGELCYCDTLDAFEVSYTPVDDESILELTQALVLQKQQGWIDDDTAMERLGNDPYMIRKRLDRQEDEDETEVAQGKTPAPAGAMRPQSMPGDMMPDDMPDVDEEDEPEMETA